MAQPKDLTPYLHRLLDRTPRELLRDARGYSLEKRVRDQHEEKYGKRIATLQADRLLLELPLKVPDLAERTISMKQTSDFGAVL